MTNIRDPLTKQNISIDDYFTELIDSKPVQRLRRVSQLGLSSVVYPGCTHTRFIHTIGVFRNTKHYINSLQISDDDLIRQLKTAAILHDTGHGPNSHAIERVEGVPKHEKISLEVVQNLSNEGLIPQSDVTPVQEMITGYYPLGVISGDIDADRLDYLRRDAHNSGIPHGSVDVETIISGAELIENDLVYDEVCIEAIESLLQSRKNMYGSVYAHPTVRSSERMYTEAIERAPEINGEDIHQYTDSKVRTELLESENEHAQKLMTNLVNRNVHKTAFCLRNYHNIDIVSIDKTAFESELKESIDAEDYELFFDWYRQSDRDLSIKIMLDGDVLPLEKLSDIDPSIVGEGGYSVRMSVYCADKYKEEVKQFCEKWFDMK